MVEGVPDFVRTGDYFRCDRSRAWLRVDACVIRQMTAGDKWGCGDCAEGKEIAMAKRDTCLNCNRPNMTMVGKDLCGLCYFAQKGKTGPERESALAEVKKKAQALRSSGPGPGTKTKDIPREASGPPAGEPPPPKPRGPDLPASLRGEVSGQLPEEKSAREFLKGEHLWLAPTEEYRARDQEIRDALINRAKKRRRTAWNEAMVIIEQYLIKSGDLDAPKPGEKYGPGYQAQ